MEGGALSNRATWLEGLTDSPPLHATHLTGSVSVLRGRSLEWLLSTSKILNGRPRKLFPILFQLPPRTRACSLPETQLLQIDLFRLSVILFGR